MARPGITYLEVAQAATTLQQKGESPTIDKVRRALGTGSNTTIAGFLKKWRTEHQPAVSALTKTTLPSELLTQLQSLWDALKDKANERTEQLEREHVQQIDEHQQIIQSLTKQLQTVEKERDHLSQANTALQQQLESFHQQQVQEREAHQQMLIRMEEQRQRLSDKESAIKDLKEQTQHIQQNLDHFRESSRQQREELILQYDAAQAELKQQSHHLTQQLENERSRTQQQALENEKQKYHYEKQVEESRWVRAQSDERYESLKELRSQLKTAQSHNDVISAQNSNLLEELTTQRQQTLLLEKSVTEYKEKWIASQAIESQQAKQIETLSNRRAIEEKETEKEKEKETEKVTVTY